MKTQKENSLENIIVLGKEKLQAQKGSTQWPHIQNSPTAKWLVLQGPTELQDSTIETNYLFGNGHVLCLGKLWLD